MNRLRKLSVLSLLAGLLALPASLAAGIAQHGAAQSDALVQDVLEVEKVRNAAVTSGDVEALKRIISREYYHVESNGRLRTRTAFLQAVAGHAFPSVDYRAGDIEVQIAPDGASAVVVGTFDATPQTSESRRIRARYVRVWVRQGASWINTVHQSTEVTPAGAAANGARNVQ